MPKGLLNLFLLTLRLNFRSRQAMVYGYLVPVLFLVAFASVFRADSPLLLPRMGQLLTISILGGACFGLPTAIVSDRERGVWRRYRMLPVGTAGLVIAILAARLVIVASAAALQIAVARLAYQTPVLPHPLQTLAAFMVVCPSFLGLGLLVASLSDDVPAVQALGQCLFLPMIMIGGVAVPLDVLPAWTRAVAGFMPGRYAVEAMQNGFNGAGGQVPAGFDYFALAVIGIAAGAIGAKIFRWEGGRRIGRPARVWIAAALLSWCVVGLVAAWTGNLIAAPPIQAWTQIPENVIASVGYADLPGDNELATRLSARFADGGKSAGMDAFGARLRDWAPGRLDNPGQSVRNLICVATIADVGENVREGEIARTVYNLLRERFSDDQLRRALAWVALYPNEGTAVTEAHELGLRHNFDESLVRDRSALYARKYLGRVLGTIRD
jgi:hypothetical protein